MAASMADKLEETGAELYALIAQLHRYALLPEKEQTAFLQSGFDEHYVPQKLKDVSKLIKEVGSYISGKLPEDGETAAPCSAAAAGRAVHTLQRPKRLLVCPTAPLKKRLRGCVESLARALVDYEQEDEKI